MTYTFRPVDRIGLGGLYAAYLDSLSSPFDSFLESHILRSHFFAIQDGDERAGFFAVLADEKMLTQFYLVQPHIRHGQEIFGRILAEHGITQAFVPSCDEIFLSHAVDRMTKLEIQAYFFQDGGRADLSPPPFPARLVRVAQLTDAPAIRGASGDFFSELEYYISRGEIFIMAADDGAHLGYGVAERGKLFRETASIGMFTVEAHRGSGVGRSILRFLKDRYQVEGYAPVAGCWVHNHASKRTLEAAGMVTKTRLFRLSFEEDGT